MVPPKSEMGSLELYNHDITTHRRASLGEKFFTAGGAVLGLLAGGKYGYDLGLKLITWNHNRIDHGSYDVAYQAWAQQPVWMAIGWMTLLFYR